MNAEKNLLDKFYNGETSQEEENLLFAYFQKKDIDIQFSNDAKVISALDSNNTNSDCSNLKEDIEHLINSFHNEKKATSKHMTIGKRLTAIAASILLIFAISIFNKDSNKKESLKAVDKISNTNEAYNATMKALLLFSENFCKGTNSIELQILK